MKTTKLNESFFQIQGTPEQLQPIMKRLQVDIPGAYFDPMVKRGLKPSYKSFYNVIAQGTIIVPSGLIPFLKPYGVEYKQQSIYTEDEILDYIETTNLPFEPYDYQIKAVVESITNQQQMCLAATGSGKSVILSLISGFLMSKGLKGLILVPSVSLTTQLHQDIKDYNLDSVYNNTHLIGGDNTDKNIDSQLTITTWQSAMKITEGLDKVNFVLVDECLHPQTKISTINGYKNIEDIQVNDYVLTINEQKMTNEYKPVLHIHKNISDNPMFIINKKLRITSNHKVLTTKGWKRTDELKIGDKILNE